MLGNEAMNAWTEEVDRLRRYLAELDALIFGKAGTAELRAARQRQKEDDRDTGVNVWSEGG